MKNLIFILAAFLCFSPLVNAIAQCPFGTVARGNTCASDEKYVHGLRAAFNNYSKSKVRVLLLMGESAGVMKEDEAKIFSGKELADPIYLTHGHCIWEVPDCLATIRSTIAKPAKEIFLKLLSLTQADSNLSNLQDVRCFEVPLRLRQRIESLLVEAEILQVAEEYVDSYLTHIEHSQEPSRRLQEQLEKDPNRAGQIHLKMKDVLEFYQIQKQDLTAKCRH